MADMSQPDGEKKQETDTPEPQVASTQQSDADRGREAASVKHDIEPADPAILAGTDMVGLNAESNAFIAARDEALRAQNKSTAQELQEMETFDNNPYGSHTAGQIRQFNAEQSGSGGGLYAGTLASQLREEEFIAAERRKDEEAAYVINAMLSGGFKELEKNFQKYEEKFQRTSGRFDRESKDTVEALDTLGDKIKEMEDARKESVERIQKLEERLKASPNDQSIQDQLKLEKAALENNDVVLHLYKETHQSTTDSLKQLRVQYGDAQREYYSISRQLREAKESGKASPEAIKDLETKLATAEQNRDKLDKSIDQLKDKVEFTRKVTEHEFSKKVDITACYTPEVTKQKVEILQARTVLMSAVLEAGQDGTVTAKELKDIGLLAKKADVDKVDVESFAKSFADSGISITDDNGQAIKGEDAGKFIMSAWENQVKTASVEVKRDIATVNVSMSKINAELAGVDAQIAALEKGAAATTAAIGNRQTVREFMDQNFSLTGFGEKESIVAVGRDPNRQLKDKTGNVVYMDTNEQFYYLKKDANGKVAKDANGDQIKVYYSKEDPAQVVDLQRKLFQEEKLPRNFFPPMTSSTSETSQYDGFISAYNRSDKASTQKFAENAQAAIQAQKDSTEANREQLARLTAQKQTLEKVKAIVESPEFKRKAAELAADGRLSHNDLKQLAGGDTQLARGLARALTDGGKNGVAIGDAPAPRQPSVARDNTATSEKAATGQRSADETLALGVPKHTPQEAADFKSKMEARLAEIKHGGAAVTMSKDEYQALAARAESLGLKGELEQGMRKNKLEVNDNGIVQNKPEPVATRPYNPVPGTGIVAQATPIVVATNAPKSGTGVYPSGMAYPSAADEYVPLNGLTASTMPIKNGTDNAPVVTTGFQKTLDNILQAVTSAVTPSSSGSAPTATAPAPADGGLTEAQIRNQQVYAQQMAELEARKTLGRGMAGGGGGGTPTG